MTGYRTYIAAALGALLHIGNTLSPDLAGEWQKLYDAVNIAVDALVVVFLRLGIQKSEGAK